MLAIEAIFGHSGPDLIFNLHDSKADEAQIRAWHNVSISRSFGWRRGGIRLCGTAKLDVGEASATSCMSRVQNREEEKRENAEAWGRREREANRERGRSRAETSETRCSSSTSTVTAATATTTDQPPALCLRHGHGSSSTPTQSPRCRRLSAGIEVIEQ